MGLIPSQPGYETRDIRLRAILFLAAMLVVMVLLVMFVSARMNRAPKPTPWVPPPSQGAALEVDAPEKMAQWREKENEKLQGYRWVDREHGMVQIPIERAMELTVQRGVNP